ncbi:MAG: hypothetical protein ACLGH2_05695 [Gammaproteobacteria bacterium]
MSTEEKARKPKLVRDSFTIPKSEYAAIDALKTRAIAQGTSVKKSELLRAGLMLLVKADEAAFKAAIAAVPSLKTGRPVAEKTQAVKAAIAPTVGKASAAPVARQPSVKKETPVKAPVTTAKAPAANKTAQVAPARKAATRKAAPAKAASPAATPADTTAA